MIKDINLTYKKNEKTKDFFINILFVIIILLYD